jgi:hypothetical protein
MTKNLQKMAVAAAISAWGATSSQIGRGCISEINFFSGRGHSCRCRLFEL